jgi:DNA-binding CsgD family transcriptional regulator
VGGLAAGGINPTADARPAERRYGCAMPAGTLPAEPPMPDTSALPARMADALPWPLLLLETDGRLLHANAAGRRLLAAGRPLQMNGPQLQPAAAAHRADFADAMVRARAGRPVVLRWPGRPGGYRGSLQALGDRAGGPALLLLALTPTQGSGRDLEAYAQAHRLSTAEARVLTLLAEGLSTPAAATRLGVSVSTVRSQVMALRRKTGHARVADLLLDLGRLPPLLAPPSR